MKAKDLSVGDTLHLDGRSVLVTRLVPSTAEEAAACGWRGVFSGSWSQTYAADEHVEATPRAVAQVAEVEQNAARLEAERGEDDLFREQIAAVSRG